MKLTRIIAQLTFFGSALVVAETSLAAELTVVQVGHFSGPQAPTANALASGAKLWFDYVSANNKIGGHKIKFVTYDDQQKVEETIRLTKEAAAKDKPVAFLGHMSTANTEALIKQGVLRDVGIASIGPGPGATSLLGSREVFTIKADYHKETEAILKVLTTIGYRKVALLIQNDPFGTDVAKGFSAAAAKLKIESVGTVKFQRDLSDLDKAADDLVRLAPDAIYLGLNTGSGLEFLGRYKAKGGNAQLVGMSIFDIDAIRKKFGRDAAGFAVSLVVPNPEDRRFELVREFHQVKEAMKRDVPSSFRVMEGFVAAKVLTDAIRRSGQSPTANRVLSALESINGLDVGGVKISYADRTRAGSEYVDLVVLNKHLRIAQ